MITVQTAKVFENKCIRGFQQSSVRKLSEYQSFCNSMYASFTAVDECQSDNQGQAPQ